jgi:hypothetical protein
MGGNVIKMVKERYQGGMATGLDNKCVINKAVPAFWFEVKALKGRGLKMFHKNIGNHGG